MTTTPISSAAPAPSGDRDLLLQLIGSLTLCDHMGDVSEAVQFVLKRIMPDLEDWDDLGELGDMLGRFGIRTLHGTSLAEDGGAAP